jgi:endogenous inhibitor of DNA gyrase (YacG/DUF329 family)
MTTQRPCARCGRPIYERSPRHPGRPKRWCSPACRRADYAERRVVPRGLEPITNVEQQVEAVLRSPAACRRVLRQLGEWAADGTLADAKWGGLADELTRLKRQMFGDGDRYRSQPRWLRR